MNYKPSISKILISLFIFGLLKIIYHLSIWVAFTDISLEPINKLHVAEIKNSVYKPRLPVSLISYADGHEIFYKNQNFQTLSALNKGIDQFTLYRRNMIEPEFYKKNKHILQEKFGAGYWLWKPHIILQAMKQAPKNSIILYMDSGFSIKGDLKPIFDALEKSDVVIPEDGYSQKPFMEEMIGKSTIQSVGIALKENEHIKPLWAAFIAIKNTQAAQNFIETWLKYCEQRELITQYLNDQMLLTLVAHKNSKSIYILPMSITTDILEWHHRKTAPDEQTLSLLPCLLKHAKAIEAKLINNKATQLIRNYILTKITNIQKRLHPNSY